MIKKRKRRNYLLLTLFFVTFLFLANFTFALEVPLPGLTCPSTGSCLPQYVVYFFNWLIGIAVVLALVSFTIGAVALISPSIEAHNEAKDRMKGASLGLILTLTSYVILRTINPAIVTNINLQTLPSLPGVYLTNGSGGKKPCPESLPDTAGLNGYDTILYDCNGSNSPPLLVWTFQNPGLENGNNLYSEVKVTELTCSRTVPVGGSFKMAFEDQGIYYCLGACNDEGVVCQGYMSGANTISGDISDPFRQNVNSIRVVGKYYGIILHKIAGLENGGDCSYPMVNTDQDVTCVDNTIYSDASAADIFTVNMDNNTMVGSIPVSSGDGVDFYSAAHGWDKELQAGYYKLSDENVAQNPLMPEQAWAMDFDYGGVNISDEDKAYCETFQDCPGSINIKGEYLIGLYSRNGCIDDTDCDYGQVCDLSTYTCTGGVPYCQTFTEDVPDLENAEPFLSSSGGLLENVYIIPLSVTPYASEAEGE